jgi:DNA-directed RNA polymerase specialized sigma24 family protein
VAIPADRDEQITRFYLFNANRLRRAIAHKTCGLNDAIIDDACAFAWEKLLGRPDVHLDRHEAYWWLYKVALRQACALGRAQRRELPAGGLNGADEDSLEPIGLDGDVCDLVADRVDRATVHEVLGRLHWRERRELLLYAHGFSYQEIAQVTGASYTAVNRWIVRGKNALRADRARRELNAGDDWPPR